MSIVSNKKRLETPFKTTAHRGVSSLAPENTLAAFMKATELGCEWIEIDVQLSLDKIPVVIHDKSVDRCSDGNGLVSEITLADLKALDMGQWFSEEYIAERIPTLTEALYFVEKHKLKINIELKFYPEDSVKMLCKKVSEVIDASSYDYSNILFSSFNHKALKLMQTLQPLVQRGQLWKKIPNDAILQLKEINAYSVHCDYRFLTKPQAEQIKQHNYQLYCYTANQPELVKQHLCWGVDMIITDKPQAYSAILA